MIITKMPHDFCSEVRAVTAKIADRGLFMKGIDYSYYYEENN